MGDDAWTAERLDAVADAVFGALDGAEEATLSFEGEATDFTRFNHARVRQSGHAMQGTFTLRLVDGQRQAGASFGAGEDAAVDAARALALLADLQILLPAMPEDPHLALHDEPWRDRVDARGETGGAAVDHLLDAAADLDAVGLWTEGTLFSGLATSRGHRCWHAAAAAECNWTVYHAGDKASKAIVAGRAINPAELDRQLERQRCELSVIAREAKVIPPGEYRVYLGPRAVYDLLHTTGYYAFGLKEQRAQRSPLMALVDGRRDLAGGITLAATRGRDLLPGFDGAGFPLPERVDLVADGAHAGSLIAGRSAAEFDEEVNAAMEFPLFLDLAGGELDADAAARELGEGLYVGDLWYLNLSDRNDCRLTGMTRFASCWVEGGEIVAPLSVMRFDDSIYRLFGEALAGLTRQRETLLIGSTYFSRTPMGGTVPGMVVEGMRFTL